MNGIDGHKRYWYTKAVIGINMKNLATTYKNKSLLTRSGIIAMAMLFAVIGPISMMQTVKADQYDERIRLLQSQIEGYQTQAAQLSQQANTYQQAIDTFTAQINTIVAQIALSQAELDKINADIAVNEKKLADQQGVLTSIISLMVSEDQTTPIEVLASSSSVGDYMMRQDQLTATSSQLKSSIDTVNAVKAELEKQKTSQEQIVADQKAQNDTLQQKKSEQAAMLAAVQGQEAAYQALIGQTNSQIASQRASQAAANATATYSNLTSGGASCGGYPATWCNAAQDTLVDNWGMYNRECVSYTAWKVAASGRRMPYWGGRGNANQWPSSAQADGIPTGYTPKVGSVAIRMSGYYGHAMYVERINNDGTIHVSQFNWLVNGQSGRYSEMDISSSGLVYVYF